MSSRGSLFRKYVIYFVAVVSTSLIVSAMVGLYFTFEEGKTARINLQREKAEAAASRIESYISEIERQIRWMHLQVGRQPSEQRHLEYLKLMRQVPAISRVTLLDQNGHEQLTRERFSMELPHTMEDIVAGPLFSAAIAGKAAFSQVYFHKGTEPYITVAVGARTRSNGATLAEATVAEVNLTFIWELMSRIAQGTGAFAYIVDSGGQLVAHTDMSEVLRKKNVRSVTHVAAALAAQVNLGARGVSISRALDGEEVLSASARVEPLGWHVFVEQPLVEALAPLESSLKRTGLLLLAGLLLSVGVSLLLARRMVRPIRAVQAGAARIAAGDLGQRIDVRTGDELQVLANEFNHMAQQLGESYTSLERKVAERTHDLQESLEQQTATSDVLKTISRSSFDLDVVLRELIRTAVDLSGADAGGLYLRQAAGTFALRVPYSSTLRLQSFLAVNAREIESDPSTAAGRAVASRQPVQIEDIRTELGHRWPESGFRTALAVPIFRESSPVGVIVVLRVAAQSFTAKQIAFVTTFADQAGIAIEHVRLFQELEHKRKELELANRHKSEFLANVSHELRTPLNAIIGFSEVLHQRLFGEINAKQAEYLADIHDSGKHLLSLINDILNLSKIEAGRMDLELTSFDVGEALRVALSLVRDRARNQRVTVNLHLSEDLSEIVADERKFKQIMLNLLSNAVKFTLEGGEISVRATRGDGGLEVAVSDSGIGIAEQHLEAIFDEFRQVGSHHVGKAEGTGLGLALTKRYVELHGGSIRVRSAIGKGSTFIFTIPHKARLPA